jgi:two-component system, cell cycle sensor histidine kinase and response regulator CckA
MGESRVGEEQPTSPVALEVFRDAIETAPEAVFWTNGEGRFVYVNERACTSLGYSREQLRALRIWDIDPSLDPDKWAHLWRLSAVGLAIESHHRRKDGSVFPVEVSAKDLVTTAGRVRIAFVRDTTARKAVMEEKARLEAQLLHAQKLESIGRLAGGVAHDFNNMLTVIAGYAELAARRLHVDEPVLAQVQEIEKAAARARDITRQLLAFSRKEMISPRPVDLNELVRDASSALSRLIGEDVELGFEPGGVPPILFDPSQMEQILVNLVVNARDAVSSGGRIRLRTASARIDEAYCSEHVDATPGNYVVLEVTDDGSGIDEQTLPHIFEPFFTTKGMGKGTGLGLAMVYGLVKQHGGFVDVATKAGKGSTFRLFVPATDAKVEPDRQTDGTFGLGHATVLVVEDDAAVRAMTQAMLETLGYTVLVAATPREALSLGERPEVRIDLLVTDVVMPQMTGPDLRDRMRSMRPLLGILFISGYASDILFGGPKAAPEHFLQKPFTIAALARAVQSVMRR